MQNPKHRKRLWAALLTLCLLVSFPHQVRVQAATQKLNKTNLCLKKGNCYTLKLKGKKGSITWKSSNKKVATVNKSGKVTAKKAGTTTISAKNGKKCFCCKIKVTTPCTSSCTSAATTKPVATTRPAATTKPVVTTRPTATTKPVVTTAPVVTTKPAVSSVPATTAQSGSVTENEAYEILNSLRSVYPEGMSLTNSNYHYYSPVFGNGYGCYGFAAKLSDTVFGTSKAYTTHANFDSIRVGDNIRIGNRHSVICLTKQSDYITVVEGNYNSSVHWDRKITRSSLASDGFLVYTRY